MLLRFGVGLVVVVSASLSSSNAHTDSREVLDWVASLADSATTVLADPAVELVDKSGDGGGPRGLYAMRDLKRGELIVEVPREAIMSRTSARRSPEIGHLLRRLPGHLALAIHVLFESKVLGPASKF